MKKFFMAVIALMMTISASAQFYIYCNDGNVIKVDSISMVAPDADESNTGKTNIENGYEYVDLGLSVKWATCNVGADRPEDYGDYFAWGETEPKEVYSWNNYKYTCFDSDDYLFYLKYCDNADEGVFDNKTTLELEDDAAHVNWGGSWRMPTIEELEELYNNCTWEWTTLNGVNGHRLYSKKKGYQNNSIFLPAAGYKTTELDDVTNDTAGHYGNYWSSSLGYLANIYGRLMCLDSNVEISFCHYYRSTGLSIRPVCP